LILPNLPLLQSTRTLGAFPRGYINLECLPIGTLGVLPRTGVLALLCVESLADFAYSDCNTCSFSLESLASSVRYLPQLPRDKFSHKGVPQ
jgi:hypothetical protein